MRIHGLNKTEERLYAALSHDPKSNCKKKWSYGVNSWLVGVKLTNPYTGDVRIAFEVFPKKVPMVSDKLDAMLVEASEEASKRGEPDPSDES